MPYSYGVPGIEIPREIWKNSSEHAESFAVAVATPTIRTIAQQVLAAHSFNLPCHS
jgi:hypothetical protein